MLSTAPLRIGQYSVIRKIGSGATSDVYLAQDESFSIVAIKKFIKLAEYEEHKQMFLTEVELGKKMHHKNIVHVISANTEDTSGTYLVMEFVKGESLDHYERSDNLLPINSLLSIIEQVAKALQYAARMNIVHRDVKPANIILMPNGTAKLTDFGCAVPTSKLGYVVAGSLAYMSPEQLEGEPLDQRADIYSLGAVLYRLLTSKYTFEADNNFDARNAILNFPITPIEKYRKGLPRDLVAVIERAMDKDLTRRYADWDAFIHDFGNAAQKIKMSDNDLDLYRGFSVSTQSTIYNTIENDNYLSRSGFTRSGIPANFGV